MEDNVIMLRKLRRYREETVQKPFSDDIRELHQAGMLLLIFVIDGKHKHAFSVRWNRPNFSRESQAEKGNQRSESRLDGSFVELNSALFG